MSDNYPEIDMEIERPKKTRTAKPYLNLVTLRLVANLMPRCISPSQIGSILKEYGFEETPTTSADAESSLLRVFEFLDVERRNNVSLKITVDLFDLYTKLKGGAHDSPFHKRIRDILKESYFNVGYDEFNRRYIVTPFETPIRSAFLRAKGQTEKDLPKQQRGVAVNLQRKPSDQYIVKEGEEFKYNGVLLEKIGKRTDYYVVFDALYSLSPRGGTVGYDRLSQEVKDRIHKTMKFSPQKMAKFLSDKLGKNNGFMYFAKEIPETLPSGKPLIQVERGVGIVFNNTVGT
jgi:hypothetical protein